MKITQIRRASVILVAGAIAAGAVGQAAHARVPAQWKNCTVVNKKYAHGIGKAGARDHTSGTPVTTFTHNTKLYQQAISANGGLDRDKDGIACEQL